MKVKFRNNLYTPTIQDGNLVLESLHETFIFEGLGTKIEDECDSDYWKEGFKHTSRSDFESDWMDTNLQFFVDVYREEAQKVNDLSKMLN
jgi:hypothetical protein